jgi:hypothetical protein
MESKRRLLLLGLLGRRCLFGNELFLILEKALFHLKDVQSFPLQLLLYLVGLLLCSLLNWLESYIDRL